MQKEDAASFNGESSPAGDFEPSNSAEDLRMISSFSSEDLFFRPTTIRGPELDFLLLLGGV